MNGLKTASNPHQLKKVNRPYIKCADGFFVCISQFHLDYMPELVYNINCKTVAACIDEEWRAAAAKLSKRS